MKDLEELEELATRKSEELMASEHDSDIVDNSLSTEEVEPDVDPEVESDVAPEDTGDKETIIVDGEELEENVDDLLEAGKRAKQKELAADAKFQQAAKLQAEVEARAAELGRLEESLREKREALSAASSENLSEEFSEALLMDEKKAGEMFAQALSRQRDLEHKLSAIDGTLRQVNQVSEMQVRNQGAEFNRYYQKEYSDIAGNDMLHKIAIDKAREIRRSNPGLSEFDIIDRSAKEVRTFVKELSGDKAIEKKRQMVRQPHKAGGRTRGKPEPKPETRDDVMAGLRAAKAFI